MKLEAVDLAKRFNREWIFKGFTYTFEPTRVYAVTGPNGSGKSTLLRILWGQLPASVGDVRHYHGDLIPMENVYRHVAIATPYMDLVEEFTLEEMVNFHFRFKQPLDGMSPRDVLERLNLPANRDKRISTFSSGMKQRLKLGLAFFSRTPFLFLDEPSTNLDENSFQWYLGLLSEVRERLVVIASNQAREYGKAAVQIDILAYK